MRRNLIDWSQAPADADGWCRSNGKAFWFWVRKDDYNRMERLGPAPDFVPDDPLDCAALRGYQPQLWRRMLWALRLGRAYAWVWNLYRDIRSAVWLWNHSRYRRRK